MSTITIDRATVEQALEALEDARTFTGAWPTGSKAITNLRAALAQQAKGGGNLPPPLQAEPVEEPVYKVKVTGRWHDAEPLPPAFSLPDGEHLLYTATRKAEPVLQALQTLMHVCQRMDLEHQAERPSEAEYQAAMKAAQEAIQAVEGAA